MGRQGVEMRDNRCISEQSVTREIHRSCLANSSAYPALAGHEKLSGDWMLVRRSKGGEAFSLFAVS
jgi:hypothetical protein